MEIREANEGDLDALASIVRCAYEPHIARIGRRPAPMDDDLATRIASGQVWLAAAEGIPLGLIVVVAHHDHLLIENVAVDPEQHGRGIGKALLEQAETIAGEAGLPEIRLYTNAAMSENLTPYPHLGYRRVGQRQNEGFDRVFFVKPTPVPPGT